jgi:hypothetical protein
MEISPISGIRVMPVVKTPPAESDLSKVFDITNSSQAGDDSYSGSGKKAGGQDEDDDEDKLEDDTESTGQAANGVQVNFFA